MFLWAGRGEIWGSDFVFLRGRERIAWRSGGRGRGCCLVKNGTETGR